ncbi:MAG: excinuclease ABC subunit UvrC [Clostridiales bacterium]|nr:excinuclease ABC subunit UvrC [Clostridiales bacterium]
MFDIKENLKKLPDSPGVYIHKDKLGQVIYVGKAVSLKNRVRQYFQSPKNMPAKVRAMVSHIEEFEYITTNTEMEALILECTLIKRYMPKYNVLLRDDKTYPYIKITMDEEYPRLVKTRRVEKDGCKYFGPYADAGAVNQMIDLLNNIFVLKRCATRKFPEIIKPCLNYHINQCRGICTGKVSRESYMQDIMHIMDFLNGKTKPLVDMLTEKMLEESELLNFERAAELRDYIEAAKTITEKQRVVLLGLKDLDIALAISSSQKSYVVLFFVRNGKLTGRESFAMEGTEDKNELVSEFLKQYYSENPNIPYEILVEQPVEESELIEDFLGEIAGRQVKITLPQRGDKKDLLKLAQKDSIELLKSIDERENNHRARREALSKEIGSLIDRITGSGANNPLDLQLDSQAQKWKDYRVEAYDISNTNGIDSVGAMVVFEGLKPNKKEYRRFKIRTVEGPNDYGSMQEVLYRRFKRALEGDPSFKTLPHILFIDGGKGQVSAVQQILHAMKINVAVAGMAKDDKHRTRALIYKPYGEDEYEELLLKEHPLLFKYTGAVQEEVHRFAIDYHRGLRGKRIQGSVLDEIDGIGSQRRNSLLIHFGSLDKIKSATIEELCEAPGITESVAKNIREYFD